MVAIQQSRSATPMRIVRDPKVCGGEPTIAGTRVPVRAVVVSTQLYQDEARVRQAYPRLSAAAIQAALSYYAAHRAEIDRLIEENEQAIAAAD